MWFFDHAVEFLGTLSTFDVMNKVFAGRYIRYLMQP